MGLMLSASEMFDGLRREVLIESDRDLVHADYVDINTDSLHLVRRGKVRVLR